MTLIFRYDCAACGDSVQRIFTDSYTGTQLCLHCLQAVAPEITDSPATEPDSLKSIIRVIWDVRRVDNTP